MTERASFWGVNWGWGKGRCWGCGNSLVPNEVAGMCPPCQWSWPTIQESLAANILVREKTGSKVYAIGFRLRKNTPNNGQGARGASPLLHRVKYGGFPRNGRSFGIWMSHCWQRPPHTALLVPVPLHWRRKWRRGFNPSESLAIGLAQGWGLEKPQDLLRRMKHQTSLSQAS